MKTINIKGTVALSEEKIELLKKEAENNTVSVWIVTDGEPMDIRLDTFDIVLQ